MEINHKLVELKANRERTIVEADAAAAKAKADTGANFPVKT